MKKVTKPEVLLPIFIGIAVGTLLFIMGNADDAPGLCLIGLASAFLLIMWGINNTGILRRGFLAPILLLSFGGGGIVLSIAMLLDGEFEESPGIAFIGVVLGVILIVLGTLKLRTAKVKKA